jgi:4-hydroxybutyryl-CoA dehydratase / vinylacetyl-CoA-Delta-isomerase
MKIVTKEDYIKSLRDLRANIYYNGRKVEDATAMPGFVPHINSAAKTYELALMPEYEPPDGQEDQPLHPHPPVRR